MTSPTFFVYRTPHGPMTIGVDDDAVCAVELGERRMPGRKAPTEVSNACATELLEYFAGKRFAFDVPTAPKGSDFQLEVWRAAESIPYGQTRTNSEIAEAIGKPRSFRMVGSAAKRNPIAILVPTHRIVGASGATAGTGRRAALERALVDLERRHA